MARILAADWRIFWACVLVLVAASIAIGFVAGVMVQLPECGCS